MLSCQLLSTVIIFCLASISVHAKPTTLPFRSVNAATSTLPAATILSPTTVISTAPLSTNTAVSPLGSSTDMFVQGQACRASWIPASTSSKAWKNMTIELMTGSNLQMTKLAIVARDIDGTNPSITSYNYSCPIVSPNAAIYFLQYTHDNGQEATWTSRFAIANLAGIYFPAPNANQPQGGIPAIPWGQGVLVNAVTSSANTTQTPSASILADTAQDSQSSAQQSGDLSLRISSMLCTVLAVAGAIVSIIM